MNTEKLLSIVIPVFNEKENIVLLVEKIHEVIANQIEYEIVLVDDASTDGTLELLRGLSKQFPSRIRYISFARNFGHQVALRAGLLYSKGDGVITMDGDFQHPPEIIPLLLEQWINGCQVVSARRKNEKEGALKKLTSKAFYKLNNVLTECRIEEDVADFRLIDRRVVEYINNLKEEHLFIRGIVAWLGFTHGYVDYEQPARLYGKSKYTLKKMFMLAFSAITSFSVRPLRWALLIGVFFSLAAWSYGLYAIIAYLRGSALPGWTSILASILLIGGIQLMCMGIIGEYLGKVHMQAKYRPFFVIKDKSE
ncbi:MAG: glycosyltransferase family 2 protein [Synergistaceae bacterium]|jgi:dolichol-phosphate mannosyltransferase|nr:glycosyltransferase family 2 protein [Synergistaceae bacterium]